AHAGDTTLLLYSRRASFKKRASKARGSSSRIETISLSPWRLSSLIDAFLQNSQMICLQVPHGGVNESVSATTVSSVNSRSPSESPFQIATRSAQTVRP